MNLFTDNLTQLLHQTLLTNSLIISVPGYADSHFVSIALQHCLPEAIFGGLLFFSLISLTIVSANVKDKPNMQGFSTFEIANDLCLFLLLLMLYIYSINIEAYNKYLLDVSPITTLFKMTVIFISIFIFYMNEAYVNATDNLKGNITIYKHEYIFIKAISVFISCLLLMSNDLLNFYILLELQSITLYILCAMNNENLKSMKAGMRYFLLGGLSGSFFLFGSCLIYGYTGTIYFDDLAKFYVETPYDFFNLGVLGFLFILSSFMFKLSITPYHVWAPSVYEGTPTILTVYLATISKLTIVFISFKFLYYIYNSFFSLWGFALLVFGLLSILVGAYAAPKENNLKRFLAYSSIVQMGNVILAISTYTSEGLEAAIFFTIMYSIIALGIFSLLVAIPVLRTYIVNLKLLPEINFGLTVLFSFLIFSLAGIPFFAGFWGKFLILFSLISSKAYTVVYFFLILTFFSSIYYIILIKVMYFEPSLSFAKEIPSLFLPHQAITVFSLMSFINISLFLYSEPLLVFSKYMAYMIF